MSEFRINRQQAWLIQNADVINNGPPPRDFRKLGMRALALRQYQEAVSHFSAALRDSPDELDLHYYLALTLLGGERPNRQARSTIDRAEAHLRAASTLPHALALATLIAEDYDLSWRRFSAIPPSLDRLARCIAQEHRREILDHVPAPEARTWQVLQRKGGRS